ncbi:MULTISPECIES: AMP-binding protein [unclassified Streptomyces]|uniref:AMP-binding protein n=1 Tax=unclassified Streptomyces TaxID=2593676 RepID=UPI003680B54D
MGMAETSIPQALARAAGHGGSLTVLDAAMRPARLSLRELDERAAAVATGLRRAGVAPGDRVCVLAPTSPRMLLALFGLWRLGAVAVMLPHERRGDAGEARGLIVHRVAVAGATALLTDRAPEVRALLAGPRAGGPAGEVPAGFRVLGLDEATAGVTGTPPPVPEADRLGMLQFTSGTTGTSKAVPVRQGQLIGNVLTCMEVLGMRPGHTYVSWLPFYHDMGIVSVAGLLAQGVHAVVLPTENFLRRPSCWMETVSTWRAEITAAPDSAYRLAAKAQQLRPAALDLSRLRVAINGAEAVTADIVDETLRVLGTSGMPAASLCPTYGMAETTLVVSAAGADRPVRVLGPEEGPAGGDGYPRPARPLVSCGRPLPGTGVSVRSADGRELPEGHIGEVQVRGPGVTDGYWRGPGVPPDTAGVLTGGRLRTGDLGFLYEGELYVCGRIKDMIIAGGRNLYPEDYEIAADGVPGVRPGQVIAFSLPDTERMVVVAEGMGGEESLRRTARELFDRLRATVQHAPAEVVVVRAATLPKTSSGKKRRGACRELYLSGGLQVVSGAR